MNQNELTKDIYDALKKPFGFHHFIKKISALRFKHKRQDQIKMVCIFPVLYGLSNQDVKVDKASYDQLLYCSRNLQRKKTSGFVAIFGNVTDERKPNKIGLHFILWKSYINIHSFGKWNKWGSMPHLCTYRLKWVGRTGPAKPYFCEDIRSDINHCHPRSHLMTFFIM